MSQTTSPSADGMATEELDFQHRQHKLLQPVGLKRLSLTLTNLIEAAVVRASIHPDAPVYDPAQFPWTAPLCAEWQRIRAELDVVMRRREQLPNFQDILPDAATICQDDGWKTYWLSGIGMDCSANRAQCPATTALLQQVPGLRTAFFSILAPGKHIPAHRGAYNGVLRFHLGLKVPEPNENCRIRIANQWHHWREGEALVFDDSFQHEVWNQTEGERVVLFIDFARPLRQPWHWLNERLLDLGRLAPFLRDANARQLKWARHFHQ